MSKIFQFGERVEGYDIPVLNEREIRAAAGILFLMMFTTITQVGASWNFTPLKYAIIIFLIDISIRVFINPKFSPFLTIGRFIVRNQVPEYVGAPQKKFAWVIGVVLALTMFGMMVVANTFSPVTSIICLICLIFLFFEAAFGICLGCKVYALIYRKKAMYCPGEVCSVKDRHDIQKSSLVQWLLVIMFTAAMIGVGMLYHPHLLKEPQGILGATRPDSTTADR
ncbi:MAG: DUF4395 domain-containing protein [Deltaproteobacteria bacterium]|nr:DUF4395 domain-containing protein [Deltaproteobacteria bacterium]